MNNTIYSDRNVIFHGVMKLTIPQPKKNSEMCFRKDSAL